MTKKITIPSLKPNVKLELGPKDDVHAFEVVARTHKVDEAIDELVTEQTAALHKLEENGDLEWVPVAMKAEHDCALLDILLDPTDDKTERAGELAMRLYEAGEMTSGQITSITEQIKEISRPT